MDAESVLALLTDLYRQVVALQEEVRALREEAAGGGDPQE